MKKFFLIIWTIVVSAIFCACSIPGASSYPMLQNDTSTKEFLPFVEATFHDTSKVAVFAIIIMVVIVILYFVLKKAELAMIRIRRFIGKMDYNLKLKITQEDAQKWVSSDSDFTLVKKDSSMIVSTPISFDGALIDLTLVKEKEKENEVKSSASRN